MRVGIGISQFSRTRACTVFHLIGLSSLVCLLFVLVAVVRGQRSSCQALQISSFSVYPTLDCPAKVTPPVPMQRSKSTLEDALCWAGGLESAIGMLNEIAQSKV